MYICDACTPEQSVHMPSYTVETVVSYNDLVFTSSLTPLPQNVHHQMKRNRNSLLSEILISL